MEDEIVEQTDDEMAQAAFDAEDNPGKKIVPTVTPEPEAKVEPEAETKPEPVEYAQITKAEYDALMAKADRADIDKAFGKIGGLERDLKQMQATEAVQVTADSFPKLKAEFPELAELQAQDMRELLAKVRGGGVDHATMEKLVSDKVEEVRRQAIDTSLDAVAGGDWVAEVNSPAYKTWIAAQPAEMRALESSDSIRDAAKLLRAFKSYVPPVKSTRKQQLEAAAATPKGTGGGRESALSTDEAMQAAFDAQDS